MNGSARSPCWPVWLFSDSLRQSCGIGSLRNNRIGKAAVLGKKCAKGALSALSLEEHPFSCCSRRTIQKRSEEHTSELQSRFDLVCRLLLEKKKTNLQSN